ncbi:unnamed protein product [Chondrus crispus]|uniref:Uncharacterized protein n=1 Tax=Chondrus crispus TaxID=2769 RepID=R7Q9G1_CHOCR|nr:unnamed protein product [Chondrus crispus]CDF35177.1 unnamed protein product [Chondrus crispus]|eukprot:XP_005714996.1 unnamed protein product [Chondrus crispus]
MGNPFLTSCKTYLFLFTVR